MAKKCPKCEECPAGEKWAVPFADFLSLLLALFIALYALASVNLEKQKAKGGNLEEVVEGTFMAIPAQLLFEQGKAELTNQYAPVFLSRMAKLFAVMPEDTEINVKGYAEESEVRNSKYQDALELSTARANNVIRELIKYKISPNRLYSSGFGSSKAESLTDKRIVEFELRTMKETKTDDVDFDSIFEKMKK